MHLYVSGLSELTELPHLVGWTGTNHKAFKGGATLVYWVGNNIRPVQSSLLFLFSICLHLAMLLLQITKRCK